MFGNLLKSSRNVGSMPSTKPGTRKVSFKGFFGGLAILAVLLVVAIVAAATNYSTLAWIVVVVVFLWLAAMTAALILVVRFTALSYSGGSFPGKGSACPSAGQCSRLPSLGTDPSAAVDTKKIAHSFEIIKAQSLAVLEYSGKDAEKVRQAAQAINDAAVYGEELMEARRG